MNSPLYTAVTERGVLYPITMWCEEQWGPRWNSSNLEGTWSVYWGGNRVELLPSQYAWHFKTEEQLMWFLLRWGT
jgi:hypothetical protein